MDQRLEQAWWGLRIGLGVGPFLAGLDKFFNVLVDWEKYLSPIFTRVVPLSPRVTMGAVGVIEMIVGILVLTGMTRIGGYVVAAWLTLIAINLVTTGQYFDVAVRDLEIALAAFTMARLSEVRARVGARDASLGSALRTRAA
ncbi:MAG TPA: hypothetical protein VNA69_14895 [Thermoanaerobaculia bacterium]|nr:hypothetical protein [Thermoanaerobaculia bacterium]